MSTSARCICVVVALCLSPAVGRAADWPNWRGPDYDGSSSETNLPTDFSKTQNVKWSVNLPGPSAATPIVHGERVFISSTKPDEQKLLALCYDRRDGKQLWSHIVGDGLRNNDRTNYASPSPVTDGKLVVFLYGNGDVAAFTVEGEKLWAMNLQQQYGQFAYQWTYSASPALLDNKLYIQVLQRDQPIHDRGKDGEVSYILAIDPPTGKVFYQHVRPSDAQMESREAYTTPIPCTVGGKAQFLIVGGDALTGHDPDTGDELWRWQTYNPNHRQRAWRLVPTVVVGDGVALVCAPKRAPIYAIDLTTAKPRWISDDRSPLTSDVPTPLYYQNKFFVLSDVRKALSCADPKTGDVEWTINLPGFYKWRASPTGADGRIYLLNHHGDVLIVDPADGKIIAHIPMGNDDDDYIRSSIAVAEHNLFIRTNTTLFCVGE